MALSSPINLQYGIDYDYVIESFFCEYKLDKDAIMQIVNEYAQASTTDERLRLQYEFSQLWPEKDINTIPLVIENDIPATVHRKIYFCQSPKGADGLPLPGHHYSLKEKLLSDFRAKRGVVKKLLAKAEKEHDHLSAIRYNAQQLAIKVVCNSEYGASNNEYFPHYDPDIPSAVTFGSRSLIGFLTSALENDHLHVDEKFLNDNAKQIQILSEIGCLCIEKTDLANVDLLKERRLTLARLFDSNYNVTESDVYTISIAKSTVIYQDTDSNYYTNKYIVDYFTDGYTKCSPEIIDRCMNCLLNHNILIANFVKEGINRRPASLGFEGSFIVCRYLNRKKKYYGIKWSEDGSRIPSTTLSDDAYENGILKLNYNDYWKPKISVLPQQNGEYLYLNTNELLHKSVNYLDYVHDYNIKCTGVDLARRDQYKFINYFHMMIVQKDLRLMKYVGNNEWDIFALNEPMQHIVESVIETFRSIIDMYTKVANFQSAALPEIEFKAIDFAKTAAYRQGKQNTVSKIVKRLIDEHKEEYIPSIGERMSYIVLINDITKDERLNGKASDGNVAKKSYVIDEAINDIKKCISIEQFKEILKQNNLVDDSGKEMVDYDKWINAKIISSLDCKYYLECLCKSTALYMIGDRYQEEIRRIDEGLISMSEANKLITKLQGMIAKDYIKQYYHYGVSTLTDYKSTLKQMEKLRAKHHPKMSDVLEVFKLNDASQITVGVRNQMMTDCEDNIKTFTKTIDDIENIYKNLTTNEFTTFCPENDAQKTLWKKYKKQPQKLLGQLRLYMERKILYEGLLKIVNELEFD